MPDYDTDPRDETNYARLTSRRRDHAHYAGCYVGNAEVEMLYALDGRSLWWSTVYQQYVPWYWVEDARWWYEHLEAMPGWLVKRVTQEQ